MEDEIKLLVCFVLSVLCLVDIVLKFKKGFLVEEIRDWGFISPVYLVIIGGISIYIVGWVGWLLLIISSFCATDLVRFRHTLDKPGEDIKSKNYRLLQVKQLQAYLVIVSELICCGYVLANLLKFANIVLNDLLV